MTDWKDGSSYSKGDKNRNRISNVWIAQTGHLKISVVYDHIYHPGQWIFSCAPFFEQEELGDIGAEEAQGKAIEMVRAALEDTLVKL